MREGMGLAIRQSVLLFPANMYNADSVPNTNQQPICNQVREFEDKYSDRLDQVPTP